MAGRTCTARKGASPVVNVVGDHAGYHTGYDAPLTADLGGVVGSVSHWVRRATDADSVGADGAAAVRAARAKGGQVATLILPADCAGRDVGESAGDSAAPTTGTGRTPRGSRPRRARWPGPEPC
ncbi:MAG: hypothetical protein R3D80_20545 [Paracoccaceae bacterium]